MSLYQRLLEEKRRLGKFVLRSPVTNQQMLDRKRYERIWTILGRRYEHGMEDALDEMKRQDHFDEARTIKRHE
tara:strand:+ start:95 stop:313 length:219 start_codon:yes stop_codon:yes gene_type:complete